MAIWVQKLHHHRLLLLENGSATSGNGISGGKSSGTELLYPRDQETFDGNMVIVLAALLCALICAIGLNSIIRCAGRRSARLATENPELGAASRISTGLKKSELGRIPVVSYESRLSIPATDCPICLGEFCEGENVRVLPRFSHGFHAKCIDKWLLSHPSCPLCRQPLIDHRAVSCGNRNADGG